MYQQTVAPSGRAAEVKRPVFRLAGRAVTQDMFYVAEKAKRSGKRVFFFDLTMHESESTVPPGVCENCLGAGHLGLEVVMAGPFKSAPAGNNVLRPTWHNRAWWQVTRNLYPCPLCNAVKDIL